MQTLDELLADLRITYDAVQREEQARKTIMESDQYKRLAEQMAALLAGVPDTSEQYAMDKEAVLKILNETGQTDIPGFQVKSRKKRSVDVRAVLEAMQGDIDNLMLVASVKQKDLEDFAKANPEYKRDLRSCIREDGISVVDVLPC